MRPLPWKQRQRQMNRLQLSQLQHLVRDTRQILIGLALEIVSMHDTFTPAVFIIYFNGQ